MERFFSEDLGAAWISPKHYSPVYDADGNLLRDDRWQYTWNAENRLISVKPLTGPLSASGRPGVVENTYDWRGRRIRRITRSEETGVLEEIRCYLYDEWNVVGEFVSTATEGPLELEQLHAWGVDLSDTLQGVGGVGGLRFSITRDRDQTWSTKVPIYGRQGNIVSWYQLVQDAPAKRLRKTTYGAFGETVAYENFAQEETIPEYFFSTKVKDPKTGFSYYGYRYYDPVTGRWPSRDPIEEWGGINIYAFGPNSPVTGFDILGGRWGPDDAGISRDPAERRRQEAEAEANNAREKQEAERNRHKNRNRHNECPKCEPKEGEEDSKGRKWAPDKDLGKFLFHGNLNCYRHKNFQCCYDDDGKVVTTGPDQGTYDYEAFDPVTGEGSVEHFWEDVYPHFRWGAIYPDNQTTVYE